MTKVYLVEIFGYLSWEHVILRYCDIAILRQHGPFL
jgi:hypothetical protein